MAIVRTAISLNGDYSFRVFKNSQNFSLNRQGVTSTITSINTHLNVFNYLLFRAFNILGESNSIRST